MGLIDNVPPTGGSDQATCLLFSAAWKVIFIEIDLAISNAHLAKGTPCQTSLVNAELRTAAEYLLSVANEIHDCEYGTGYTVELTLYPKSA